MTDRPPRAPRYYSLDALKPGDPDSYFRVLSGGRYERWDSVARQWVHVTSQAARDYMSRAIENGDGAFQVKPSDIPGNREVADDGG
jgi:hypothetical protein